MSQPSRSARFPRPLTFLFALCVALTGLAAVALVSASIELTRSTRQVEHTLKVQQALETLNLTLVNAETGQRGFLLSGQSHFLQPYVDAVAKQAYYLGTLEQLVADNPQQKRALQAVKSLVDQRLAALAKTIELYPADEGRAQALEWLNRGEQLMGQVQVAIQSMRNEEDRLLAERQAEVERRTSYGLMFLLLSNAASVLGLVVLYLAMRRYHWRRQNMEIELVRSERELRQLFETSAIGQAECDPQSLRFLRTNQRLSLMTGYSSDELRRTTLLDLLPRANRLDNARALRDLLSGTQESLRIEQLASRKDGVVFWAVLHATIVQGDDTRAPRVSVAIEDASERHALEKAASRSHGLLRSIAESSHEAIFAKDVEGRWLMANQRSLDLLGRPRDEVIGKTDREIFARGEDAEAIRAADVRVMTRRASETGEDRLQLRGQEHVFRVTRVPYVDDAGELVGVVSIASDVTERSRHGREVHGAALRADRHAGE